MALDRQLQVIRDNIRLQDSALEIVKIQKQAARVNELAVQQFTAQLLNTKGLEGGVLQEITETENEINYLLGRFPQAIQRDSSLLDKPLPPVTEAVVPSQLLEQRPDIEQAKLELSAAGADVNAAQAAFFPALKVEPYLRLNSFKLPLLLNGGSATYGLLGSLTAPIFYQGALKRGLKIASAEQLDAFYNYQQTIYNGVREVVNSLSRLNNMKNIFTLKQQEVQTLDSAVVTSNLLFKTGYASYLEVITAQRNVVDAQLQLVNAKAQMFYSVVEIYRALGGGWK